MQDNHPVKDDVDLGLAVMRSVCPEMEMSIPEMAEVCNCHPSLLYVIFNRACKKMRARLREEGIMVSDLKQWQDK